MTYYFHRNWNFQTVMLLEHLTADKVISWSFQVA